MHITRRSALLGLTAAFSCGNASLALAAAPTERRLVVVLLRGALDGLAAVPPYGDGNLLAWRGELLAPPPGQPDGMHDLGGYFGLHPALPGLAGLYRDGDLAVLHAVAGPTRSRSHFEAQDCLESGADKRMSSGWLNRAVGTLKHNGAQDVALSVGVSVPLLLRGPAAIGAWAPQDLPLPAPDLYARVAELNHDDPLLGPALADALRERGFSATTLAGMAPSTATERHAFPTLAATAGKLLAAADGPRVAALEIGGWDTHAAQANRLLGPLRTLDAGMLALRDGLGAAWSQSAVLVMTEFGRTVRPNGTHGTDHGTAGAAFLAGGAVRGGRVLGTWPGLAATQLLDNRDLAPTTDLRAVAKALLIGHLGVPANAMVAVFPGADAVSPMGGLLRG